MKQNVGKGEVNAIEDTTTDDKRRISGTGRFIRLSKSNVSERSHGNWSVPLVTLPALLIA